MTMNSLIAIHKVSGGKLEGVDWWYFKRITLPLVVPIGSSLLIGQCNRHFEIADYYQMADCSLTWVITKLDTRAFNPKTTKADLTRYCAALESEGWTMYGNKLQPLPQSK